MNIILAAFLVCLTRASAIEFPDSNSDGVTDESLTLLTTTEVPERGTTLGEVPDQVTNGNVVHDFEVTVDGNRLTESYPPLEIPENHKNYTSPFVSSIELPPLLNQFNVYQQQYRDYYKQKSEYGNKPLKFETGFGSNHYVPHGLGTYLEDDARHRYEEMKYDRQPFPYTYENERLPLLEQSLWAEHSEAQPLQNEVSVHYYQPHELKPEGDLSEREKGEYGWKKALKFFTALVPLGLLLATLTPTVISINSTVDQKPVRQRSLNHANLTGDEIHELFRREYGGIGTTDPECEKKLICEVSTLGRKDTATYMQKSFWYLANKIPDEVAEELGTRELFQAIRGGNCEFYKCPKKPEGAVTKKVTKRKRKKVAGARAPVNTGRYSEKHDLYNR